MRKKIIAGNWKMNKTLEEAVALFSAIDKGAGNPEKLEAILLFPPLPFIQILAMNVRHKKMSIGAQNVAAEAAGAYTGEVAADMLKSVKATHVLIGHSERRIIFNEGHEILKKKVDLTLANDLIPVFCCGEKSEEREQNTHFETVEKQLMESVFHLNEKEFGKSIIAYEPVWAIGTGKTASVNQAEEMHAFIRNLIEKKYDKDLAGGTMILYGGSCNAGNAAALFASEHIDGGLIGGASLKVEEFLSIIAVLND